jgi:hypothetical protein
MVWTARDGRLFLAISKGRPGGTARLIDDLKDPLHPHLVLSTPFRAPVRRHGSDGDARPAAVSKGSPDGQNLYNDGKRKQWRIGEKAVRHRRVLKSSSAALFTPGLDGTVMVVVEP